MRKRQWVEWGAVPGLDKEEEDNGKLEREEDAVHNVVLPADALERDRVQVVVEEERQVDAHEQDRHSTGTDLVGQNLDGVADQQAGPGQIVAGEVQEDQGDDGGTGRLGSVLNRVLGSDGPADKHDAHTTGGDEEKRATTGLVDGECHAAGDEHVPDVEAAVDDVLGFRVLNADLRQDVSDVVRHERVARQLREETGADADKHAVAVTARSPQLRDADLGHLQLDGEGLLDLGVLVLNQLVVPVAVGVVARQDVERFVGTVVGNEPTRGLGDEKDEGHHQDGGGGLEHRRDAPRPSAVDAESTIRGPGGDDGADVPGGVVERRDTGTVLVMSQLCDEKGGGTVCKGDTETDLWTSYFSTYGIPLLQSILFSSDAGSGLTKKREAVNIARLTEAVWRATPTNMIVIPMVMARRRPRQSASQGEIGMAQMDPTERMALRRPRSEEEGSKSDSMLAIIFSFQGEKRPAAATTHNSSNWVPSAVRSSSNRRNHW